MHCTGRLHHGRLTGHNELFGTNNNYYKDFGYSIRPSDVSKKVCWAALITLILTKTFKHKQSGQKSKLCYYAFSLRLSVLFPCPFNCLWQNDATTITCITDRCAAYSVFINKKQKILKKKNGWNNTLCWWWKRNVTSTLQSCQGIKIRHQTHCYQDTQHSLFTAL